MKIANVNIVPDYVKLGGGLDLVTPPLTLPPGALIACRNYISAASGGYQRIDAYERYSGQPSPSDADYYYCECTLTTAPTVGDTVTGVTSGATGVVCTVADDESYINITKVTGTFEAEDITVAAVNIGSFDTAPSLNGAPTAEPHANALNDAATQYRSDISHPGGSGAVRGFGLLKGTLYCFKDNSGATAGTIYKATASGWSEIDLYSQISFDTGSIEPDEGDTLTGATSGATATIKRVVMEDGTWAGGDAEGRIILDSVVGTFQAAENLQVGAVTQCVSTSAVSAITISPGGRYIIKEYNFSGDADKRRLYGCDGVNAGFEFDGDVYVPLATTAASDVPTRVFAHKYQLFFGFEASFLQSAIGDPYQYTAMLGTAYSGLGDILTNFETLPGQALFISTEKSTYQLLGSDSAEFVLDLIDANTGAKAYTAQALNGVYSMGAEGIFKTQATDAYGNFAMRNISQKISSLIKDFSKNVVASTLYKNDRQIRYYASDGSGVAVTLMENGRHEFSSFEYPDNIVLAISGPDSNGNEVIFLGSDDGKVFQADKGSSFDGEAIEAFIIPVFNHSKSPSTYKTYRKAVFELNAQGYAELKCTPDFSYASSLLSPHTTKDVTASGLGGFWDVAYWDSIFYDTEVVAQPSISIQGTGKNITFAIYSNSAIDLGHKLDGVLFHYTPRRIA